MKFKIRDVHIEHLRRSGPGGQHRNRKSTGVRATHLPTGIFVMATERRSQKANLEAALERLEAKLYRLTTKPKIRMKTKPTTTSKERRLQNKKLLSQKKRFREKVSLEN